MGTLLRVLGAGCAYFCIATLLAQATMLGYLWWSGSLDRQKLVQLVTVARAGELARPAASRGGSEESAATLTLADIEAARAVRLLQLELREQAAENVLSQVRFETERLSQARERFDRVHEKLLEQLGKDEVAAITQGNENARLLLESVKPKQSKELIMEMLKADEIDEVVTLLGAMPIAKRAKIAAEFKTEEETRKLDEILRRTRQGLPDTAVIEQTRKALEQPAAEP
jgi:hypothetical protein